MTRVLRWRRSATSRWTSAAHEAAVGARRGPARA